MPIYEYDCRSCNHHFEKLVFGKKTPSCPQCESESVEKAFSVFAVGRSTPSTPCASEPAAACATCPGSGGGCPAFD